MAAIQQDPDADARIEQLEQEALSAIDDVLMDAEAQLRPVLDEVTEFFDTADDPTVEERIAADRADNAPEAMHELLARKVASLSAQARAQELSSTATTTLASATEPPISPQPQPATIAEPSPPTAVAGDVAPLRPGRPTQVGYGNPDSVMRQYAAPPAAPSPTLNDTVSDAPAPTAPDETVADAPPVRRFCTQCGGPVDATGTSRVCPACGHTA